MTKTVKTSGFILDEYPMTPSQFKDSLKVYIKLNMLNAVNYKKRRPIMAWGPPGVGKSETIEQVARELGMDLKILHLSQFEPTDLRGIPVPVTIDTGNGVTETIVRWAIPEILPRKSEKPGILFLDELSNAEPDILKAAYQLILDGKLGEYTLPDNWVVVAAGNRDTDRGSTYKMPTPLLNRFTHFAIKHSYEEWEKYALTKKFHPAILGYLSAFPQELFVFDPATASNERAFRTPRSWESLSDMLNNIDGNVSDSLLRLWIIGTIGNAGGVKFHVFLKKAMNLPFPMDILNGKITKIPNVNKSDDKISYQYALMTSLSYKVKDLYDKMLRDVADEKDAKVKKQLRKTFSEQIDTCFLFFIENMQPEICVVGFRTIFALYGIDVTFEDIPRSWPLFKDDYKDILMSN